MFRLDPDCNISHADNGGWKHHPSQYSKYDGESGDITKINHEKEFTYHKWLHWSNMRVLL